MQCKAQNQFTANFDRTIFRTMEDVSLAEIKVCVLHILSHNFWVLFHIVHFQDNMRFSIPLNFACFDAFYASFSPLISSSMAVVSMQTNLECMPTHGSQGNVREF